MFIVDFLLTGGLSMAGQLLPDTVGRQQWGKAEAAPQFLVCYGFPPPGERRCLEARSGRRSRSLFLKPSFRLCSGARVSSATFKPEQDKAFPLYLGFWGSGPAVAWQAEQIAAAYFPTTPVNSRRRSCIRTYLGNHFRYLASRVLLPLLSGKPSI